MMTTVGNAARVATSLTKLRSARMGKGRYSKVRITVEFPAIAGRMRTSQHVPKTRGIKRKNQSYCCDLNTPKKITRSLGRDGQEQIESISSVRRSSGFFYFGFCEFLPRQPPGTKGARCGWP